MFAGILAIPVAHLILLVEGNSDWSYVAGRVIVYDAIDFIFCGVVILLLVGLWGIFDKAPLKDSWPKRMSVISGLLSLASLVGLTATSFGSNDMAGLERFSLSVLAFLIIPGFELAILAVITGAIAYKRERSRIGVLGVVLGIIAIVSIVYPILTVGGAPVFCRSDAVCNVVYPYDREIHWACSLRTDPAKIAGICLPPAPPVNMF